MIRIFIIAAAVILAAAPPAAAQDDPIMEGCDSGDGPTARQMWEQLAETDDYIAQVNLGWLLSGDLDPKGVPVDLKKARYWMEQAVAQRELAIADELDVALLAFASALESGEVESVMGKVDAGEIVEWYSLAAQLAPSLAAAIAGTRIGQIYEVGGQDLAGDHALALEWYEWAAPASPVALAAAGKMHLESERIERALYWADHAWVMSERGVENVWGSDPYDDGQGYNFAAFADELRLRAYDGLFPSCLPEWKSLGLKQKMHTQSEEGGVAIERDGDEVRYPIRLSVGCEDEATGAAAAITIILNQADLAAGWRKLSDKYDNLTAAQKSNSRATGYYVEEVAGYRAMPTPGDGKRHYYAYYTVLEDGSTVSSETIISSGDAQTDRKIALDYLRAFDFQKIIEGTRGHGVFIVSDDGTIVKF